jgi:endonuclease/exonuclease/phosphatase (EEP) superfamily protein YafD
VIGGVSLLAVFATMLALVTAPGPSPVTGMPPVIQLIALRGLVALGSTLAALVLAVMVYRWHARRATAALLATLAAFLAAAAAIQVAVLSDRGTAMSQARPATGPNQVVVVAFNTFGALTAQEIADFTAEREADVVALPETSRVAVEKASVILAAQGLHYRVLISDSAHGYERATSALVSTTLGTYHVVGEPHPDASLVAVGSGPPLVIVHTVSPVSPNPSSWARTTTWAVTSCGEHPGGIVAGDFNSTLDHPAFAHLGDCVDAAAVTGTAGVATWPAGMPRWLGAPIDHVLVDPASWDVVRTTVLDPPAGSDHRAIEAVLRPR